MLRIVIFVIAQYSTAYHDVEAEYARKQIESPHFVCVELHMNDPLDQGIPRVTLNFERKHHGDPCQWHFFPYRQIEEEELLLDAFRFTIPSQP